MGDYYHEIKILEKEKTRQALVQKFHSQLKKQRKILKNEKQKNRQNADIL